MFILRFLVRSPQLYILLRSFLRNGSIDFSDFLHEVRDCNGRKATELDFWKKILIWRYSWKGLQISPKLDALVGWLVGNAVFSGIPLRIFLIFCMKLGDYKGRKVTQPDFWKNSSFWDICEKVSKLTQIQTPWYFSQKRLYWFFWVLAWRYLTSKLSNNYLNWGFWPFSWLCISFSWFCT